MRGGALIGRDGASLAAAQAALADAQERWRSDARVAGLLADLERYGAGEGLGHCPVLEYALADPDGADIPVAALLDHVLGPLANHPLGQLPLRYGGGDGTRSLLLARRGRAQLSLVSREPGYYNRRGAAFSGGERHEVVLAGSGSGRLVRRGKTLAFKPCRFERGTGLALQLDREAVLVEEIAVRMLSLRLVRLPRDPAPTREYALDTGELLHQSAGDPEDSRRELMLALLGRMGRRDAAPVMAEMMREGGDHLRWQALRECIALDTAAGFAALCTIADSAADSLREPAMALRAQLRAAWPALEAA